MMKLLLTGVAVAGLVASVTLAQDGSPPPDGARHGMPGKPHPPLTRAGVETMVTEHFAMIDANKDGVITRDEFDAFLVKRRAEMETRMKAHRDHEFDHLDTNKDGQLSRAEFDAPPPRDGMHGRPHGPMDGEGPKGDRPPPPPGDIPPPPPGGPMGWRHGPPQGGMMAMMGPRWFEKADANHDGKVTLAEAKATALAHFDRIDTNHDGTISREEMRAMWKMHRPGMPHGGPGGPGGAGEMPPPPPQG